MPDTPNEAHVALDEHPEAPCTAHVLEATVGCALASIACMGLSLGCACIDAAQADAPSAVTEKDAHDVLGTGAEHLAALATWHVPIAGSVACARNIASNGVVGAKCLIVAGQSPYENREEEIRC